MKKWSFDNKFVLKLIALGLAIITWIYVNQELYKSIISRKKSINATQTSIKK